MKLKKIIAMATAVMMLGSTTVFAATEEVSDVTVYTYDEVLELLIKNDSSLSLQSDQIDLLKDQISDISLTINGILEITDSYLQVESTVYSGLQSITSYNTSIKTARYTEEATKESWAYVAMSTLSDIVISEKLIELADKELEVIQQDYNMANTKYKLGMISEQDFISAKTELDEYKASIEEMEKDLANVYTSLGRSMGFGDNREFKVEYEVDFELYELSGSIYDYSRRSLETNPVVLAKRQIAEDSDTNMVFSVINSDSPYAYDTAAYDVRTNYAAVDSIETATKAATESLYTSLISLEETIKNTETSLSTAQSSLAVVEASYASGRSTANELLSAELTVEKLEVTIESLKNQYMSMVYAFENPNVL